MDNKLWEALENEDLATVKKLINSGININQKNEEGFTILNFTLNELYPHNNFDFDFIKLVIDKGADVNISDDEGNSPLMYSLNPDNIDLSKLLIEHGADINAKNDEGETPINYIAKYNFVDDEPSFNNDFIMYLINKGADVNIQDNEGNSPLMSALQSALLNSDTTMAELLIKCGANLNLKNNEGENPLSFAEKYDDMEKIKNLLIKGNAKKAEEIKCSNCLKLKSELELEYKEKGKSINVLEKIIEYNEDDKKFYCRDCQIILNKEPKCAKCGKTRSFLEDMFAQMKENGVFVYGSGPVLQYCIHCKEYFCGTCQLDGGESGSKCPKCNGHLSYK